MYQETRLEVVIQIYKHENLNFLRKIDRKYRPIKVLVELLPATGIITRSRWSSQKSTPWSPSYLDRRDSKYMCLHAN